MLSKIIIPVDGSDLSEQIIPYCVALSKGLGSSMTLLHVVDTDALPDTAELQHQVHLEQLVEQERTQAHAYLHKVQAHLKEHDIQANIEVTAGPTAETIVSMAQNEGADLIAMSTHGRSGLARWRTGSVTDKVLHTATVPLLIFRPQDQTTPDEVQLSSVILPLDGSPLAAQAVPLATSVATALKLKVKPIRLVSTGSFAFTDPYPTGGAEMSVPVMEVAENDARDYLDKTAEALREKGLDVEPHFMFGEPASQIIELAHETAGSLVVMSTHGRSGLGRFVMGSVADKVLRGSGSPVLIVRASG